MDGALLCLFKMNELTLFGLYGWWCQSTNIELLSQVTWEQHELERGHGVTQASAAGIPHQFPWNYGVL